MPTSRRPAAEAAASTGRTAAQADAGPGADPDAAPGTDPDAGLGADHPDAAPAGADHPDAADRIVPQRAVIVLPSTGEFDSRTYRIARTLLERGHQVTVLARWKPGLPRREVHELGYPIVRVEATAVDGLPLRRLLLPVLRALRLAASPVLGPTGGRPRGTRGDMGEGPVAHGAPGTDEMEPGWAHPAARDVGRFRGYVRRARIFLMIRSHRRRALESAPPADIYHGMAYMGISVALALGRRHSGRVVYDSRDIYMAAANLARLRGPIKAVLARMERRWARQADRVLTVNRPYAEELARRFGVPLPVIVMNCSYRTSPPDPPERRFHEKLGLAPEVRVVLYQGGFSKERGIEQLIEAIDLVPGAVLVCLGYGELEPQLRAAAADPSRAGRVFVLPAVPPTELLAWVASADVVGALFQPTTINHRLSTPNKFLEAMAAGVPSVVSDDPGMGPIASGTGCGIPVDPTDPVAIAAAIRRIVDASPEERAGWRTRALAAAHDTYNWETQVESLLDAYTRLTGRRW